MLALTTALALWGWLRPRRDAEPPAIRFQFGSDSSHVIAQACCGAQLAVSPDGARLYYIGLQHGVRRIFARLLDSLAAHPVAGTEEAQEVFLSPDGAWIGFRIPKPSATPSANLYEIRKVPAGGGAATTIASLTGWPYGTAWLDDGTLVLAAETKLYRVSASGGDPVPVGSPDSAYTTPDYLPGSGRVLAANRRTGRVQVLSLAGDAPRDVAEGLRALYTDGHLISTGEGRTIVAQAFDPRATRPAGTPVTIAADLSRPIDLAVGPRRMLFYAVGRAGGVIETVTPDGVAQSAFGAEENATHFDNPRFSPDGKHLAAAAGLAAVGGQVGGLVLGHQIVVFDLARRTSLRLTFEGRNEFLDWSPDGRSIIYSARGSALAIQPADRSAPERILTVPGLGSLGRVTAGGRWVAFAVVNNKAVTASSDIMIAALDSMGAPRPYQATPFDEYAPALSSDGRWLAWVSNESGRDEVYASTAPAPGAQQAVSVGGGAEPVWSRDGKTLYYRTADGQLMAVSLRAGPRLEILERKPLFRSDYETSGGGGSGADYDVDPSGQRFAMMRRRSLDTRLVVMTEALRAAGSPRRR